MSWWRITIPLDRLRQTSSRSGPGRRRRARGFRRRGRAVRSQSRRRISGWVRVSQGFVAQPKPLGDALSKILDEYVGVGGHLAGDLDAFGLLEVEGDTSLVAMVGFEISVASGGQAPVNP